MKKKIAERTLLIGAGKGGVGKSTLTVNLSVAMALKGFKVGILDADLYGPSLPILMGLRNLSPKIEADGSCLPFHKFNVHSASMGFFLEEEKSVVWRGPMLHKMLDKMLTQIKWPELDYLFVDLPPGTGDVPLSLENLLHVDGALVVTTPQEVAFLDVQKAVHAFDLLKIKTLGLIENMVGPPFGKSRGNIFSERLSVPLLGTVALNSRICEGGDEGLPFAFTESNEKLFAPLADNLHALYG